MNLPKFLKNVDSLTKKMSHDQLEIFVHGIARTLPEEKREDFIECLQEIGNIEEIGEQYEQQACQSKKAFLKQLKEAQEKLTEIDDGELCLIGELNEEYDDWYNSDSEEFLFEDPNGVLDIIETAVDLIHKCVDQEIYEEGYDLADLLSVLVVQAEGSYCDYAGDPLSMDDLNYYNLLTCSCEQLIEDSLYLAYRGNELSKRPDAVYWMMTNLNCGTEFTLERIMQNGRGELEQFDEFLHLWVVYLSEQKDGRAERLILEAQSMLSDEGQMVENARRYVRQHPALYKQYLEQHLKRHLKKEEEQQLLEIGKEALAAIPVSYTIRSKVALLTAQYALYLQNTEEAERCWMEAFRSETTPVNFMRVLLECRDDSPYRSMLTDIYTVLYERNKKEKNHSCGCGERSENWLEHNDYCALLFLDGKFQEALDIGMNEAASLGWSGTFMKQGIGLFMLYLFEGKQLSAGLRAMSSLVLGAISFSVERYGKGLNREISDDNILFFEQCFYKWKERNPASEELRLMVMDRLEQWVEVRVEGIMQANRRNYYHECAAFVAALGEVKESWGEIAGKQRFMQIYRERYSRRRAFHAELKAFGFRM